MRVLLPSSLGRWRGAGAVEGVGREGAMTAHGLQVIRVQRTMEFPHRLTPTAAARLNTAQQSRHPHGSQPASQSQLISLRPAVSMS